MRRLRRISGNRVAGCWLTRREESMPRMSLVGVVANDAWSLYGNNRGSVRLTVTRKT